MPAESRNLHEQERSIKAREHELYLKPTEEGQARKPFLEYLRETPAEPLSTTTKTILWIVAVLVVVVFLAAIWRAATRRSARPRNRAVPSAVQPAALADHLSVSLTTQAIKSERISSLEPRWGSVETHLAMLYE
jgi:hypothetical protein